MPQLSTEARDFNWLVGNFAKHTPRVAHAMVVSAQGCRSRSPTVWTGRRPTSSPPSPPGWQPDSGWRPLHRRRAGQADGGRDGLEPAGGDGDQRRFLPLTVLAASACDVGVVAYETTVLGTRAGDVLTPSLRAELQAALLP
jgi:uncharacterized protein